MMNKFLKKHGVSMIRVGLIVLFIMTGFFSFELIKIGQIPSAVALIGQLVAGIIIYIVAFLSIQAHYEPENIIKKQKVESIEKIKIEDIEKIYQFSLDFKFAVFDARYKVALTAASMLTQIGSQKQALAVTHQTLTLTNIRHIIIGNKIKMDNGENSIIKELRKITHFIFLIEKNDLIKGAKKTKLLKKINKIYKEIENAFDSPIQNKNVTSATREIGDIAKDYLPNNSAHNDGIDKMIKDVRNVCKKTLNDYEQA